MKFHNSNDAYQYIIENTKLPEKLQYNKILYILQVCISETTSFVDGSITDTLLDALFVTYTLSLDGQYTSLAGEFPTFIVVTILLEDAFITVIVLAETLATNILFEEGQ